MAETTMNFFWQELTSCSQSKLSQEQLNQLQKDTHFDKKELQQWYKGVYILPRLYLIELANLS